MVPRDEPKFSMHMPSITSLLTGIVKKTFVHGKQQWRVGGHLLLCLNDIGKPNKNSLYICFDPYSLFIMFLFDLSFPGGGRTSLPNSYFCLVIQRFRCWVKCLVSVFPKWCSSFRNHVALKTHSYFIPRLRNQIKAENCLFLANWCRPWWRGAWGMAPAADYYLHLHR